MNRIIPLLLVVCFGYLSVCNSYCETDRMLIKVTDVKYPTIIGVCNELLHIKHDRKFFALDNKTFKKIYDMEIPGTKTSYVSSYVLTSEFLAFHVLEKDSVRLYIYQCKSNEYHLLLSEERQLCERSSTSIERCSASTLKIEVFKKHIVSYMEGLISVYNSNFEKVYLSDYYCNETVALTSGIYEYKPGKLTKKYDFEEEKIINIEYNISKKYETSILSSYRDIIIIHLPADIAAKHRFSVLLSSKGEILLETELDKYYIGATDGHILLSKYIIEKSIMRISSVLCHKCDKEEECMDVPFCLLYIIDDSGIVMMIDDKYATLKNINNNCEVWKIPSHDSGQTAYISNRIMQCGAYIECANADVLCKNINVKFIRCGNAAK